MVLSVVSALSVSTRTHWLWRHPCGCNLHLRVLCFETCGSGAGPGLGRSRTTPGSLPARCICLRLPALLPHLKSTKLHKPPCVSSALRLFRGGQRRHGRDYGHDLFPRKYHHSLNFLLSEPFIRRISLNDFL